MQLQEHLNLKECLWQERKKKYISLSRKSYRHFKCHLKQTPGCRAVKLWRDSSFPCRSQTFWGACYNSISFCWMCTAPADIVPPAKAHCLQEQFSLHSAHHLTHLSLITSPSRHKAQTQPKLSNHNSCQTGTTLTVQTTHWDHTSPTQKFMLCSHSNPWTALLKSLPSQRDHQLSSHLCRVTLLTQPPEDCSNLFITLSHDDISWKGPPKII